ncbi:tetraspanin [Vairimorpha necatrix]|uniref:Tetraspanin n=1 Tax=Vairimorpha necatrix TaxID=6039 RepID=A0AAX4J8E4_9MICR
MKHRNGIKKILKLSFIFIQVLTFIYAIALGVMSIILFYKVKDILQLTYKNLLLLLAISFTSAGLSLIGFQLINTKKKFKYVIYIFLSLLLMNLEFVLALKSSLLPEKSIKWGENIWIGLSEYQRNFLQEKFKCCGFKNKDDMSGAICDYEGVGCLKVLYDVSVSIRSFIERSVVFVLFIESIGLGIIATLRFRR